MSAGRDIRLVRLLKLETIELDEHLDFDVDPETDESKIPSEKEISEIVIRRCAEVLDRSGLVVNVKRLGDELLYREAQAPTAIGEGIAIPHVRSRNVRDLLMCFLRYPDGVPMESLDGKPVFMVFGIVTPYYEEDTDYQKVYRKLLSNIQADPAFREELMTLETPGEIIRSIRQRE
jgi:fructose PTS system EIIBC or EIIC component